MKAKLLTAWKRLLSTCWLLSPLMAAAAVVLPSVSLAAPRDVAERFRKVTG